MTATQEIRHLREMLAMMERRHTDFMRTVVALSPSMLQPLQAWNQPLKATAP
jgi:hypothetical protein